MPTNKRSKLIVKNIFASFFFRFVGIIISVAIVPLTLGFVNPVQYGIWLTVSSIVSWIAYFDIGLDNGLRYKFAESKALGDNLLAKKYVSTTYGILFVIFTAVAIIFIFVNHFIDWCELLNIENVEDVSLNSVFLYLVLFFCAQLVLRPVSTILTADQKPALGTSVTILGQLLSLVVVFLYSSFTKGTLIDLVFIFSGVPCAVYLICTFVFFNTKDYKKYTPSFSSIEFSLTKDILGKGLYYFFTMISMFMIFQLFNIIMTRELGPESVTEYNISYKYFNVIMMGFVIIVNPLWSAFTEAYVKKDFEWMQNIVKRMKVVACLFFLLSLVMLVCASFIIELWVGDEVQISNITNIFVCLQCVIQVLPALYVYPINGIGTMRIQTVVYAVFSVFAVPALVYLCRYYGIPGMISYVVVVYLVLWISCRIQFYKLMNGTAKGIWAK